jgi:hypothetical protein
MLMIMSPLKDTAIDINSSAAIRNQDSDDYMRDTSNARSSNYKQTRRMRKNAKCMTELSALDDAVIRSIRPENFRNTNKTKE